MPPATSQDRAGAASRAPERASRPRPRARGGRRHGRLPGRRRGARPPARAGPNRPRRRGRGRRRGSWRDASAATLRAHERFATATVQHRRARARSGQPPAAESYPEPGALPEVRPAPLAEDLARRDFTVNAMAVPLAAEPELIDPHGGPRGPRARRAASAPRRARSPTTRPAPFAPPGTRRATASRWSPRPPSGSCGRRPRRRCRATESRPSSASSPRSTRRAPRLRAARRVGAGEARRRTLRS